MVKYSPNAARALAYLKRFYNDVDIFVEDTSSPNMWIRVLQRLLPDHVQLTSVNMLGGRKAVLDACKLDQENGSRPKLYIIDADFDHLLGKKKPRLKHLYRLRAYCVENLLPNELALVEIGIEWKPERTQAEVSRLIDFKVWMASIERPLSSLFVTYATVYALTPQLATTAFPVQRLLRNSKQGVELDEGKVLRRMLSITRQACRIVGVSNFRKQRKLVSARTSSLTLNMAVSGKDYILPILLIHMQKRFGYRGGAEQLKVRLAMGFTVNADPQFARRLRSIVGS